MTKPFINITILLVLTLGIVYASNTTKTQNTLTTTYKTMSTTELQIEVEKLSNQGQLPFEMGKELMSRWSAPKNEIN